MARTAHEQGMRRVRMRFVGRVQGVGFRWTSRSIAADLGVTGWVRNECDGSVTLELQGEGDAIARFQTMLHNRLSQRVMACDYVVDDMEELEVDSGERGFSVRR